MKTRVAWLAVAAAAMVVGFEAGQASAAANGAPVVSSGSLTVHYEDSYTIHFTASDPEGDPLTVVTQPVNSDWLSCDGGPATSFTCEYSSSRYNDPSPLPTASFQRTVSYSVTDGTSTSTGTWSVTVLPPPTMNITGNPTVVEGGDAVLQLELSSNTYGALSILAHVTAVDGGDATSSNDVMIDVADGQTTVAIHVPTNDDKIAGPAKHFSLTVDQVDAIPYRFVAGGNLATVLDIDDKGPSDTAPPVVAKHRDVLVERGGKLPARVAFAAPSATDDVDGALPVVCVPGSMSVMPVGHTKVSCSATDKAGNEASSSFDVTVHRSVSGGDAVVVDGHGVPRCATPGEVVLVRAEGFTSGAQVTIQLQTSNQAIAPLQTAKADRSGRIRQLVAVPATAVAGDADVVVSGPAGARDLVRMLPVRVARCHHYYGSAVAALLRNRDCD
ncbi:MAG TPA: HYR domain-containing protein [Ilumatobacteraceae bacterium]|nr:HYR domain-containing protein [Ilumatobacteraceae bacterium]